MLKPYFLIAITSIFSILHRYCYGHIGGPGAKAGRAAERRKRRIELRKDHAHHDDKRVIYMQTLPSSSSVHIIKALTKLIDCALFSLDLSFRPLSDFDTFELFVKAIYTIIACIAKDISKIPLSRSNDGISDYNDKDLVRARWRSGPLFLSLYGSDYDQVGTVDLIDKLESELIKISSELECLLKSALQFFSSVDIVTMQKLYPEKISQVSLLKQQQSDAGIITAEAVMKYTKRVGQNFNTPPMEWELRCRKLRKFLKPAMQNINGIITSLKTRKSERRKPPPLAPSPRKTPSKVSNELFGNILRFCCPEGCLLARKGS